MTRKIKWKFKPNKRTLAKRKAKRDTTLALNGYVVLKRKKRGFNGRYSSNKLKGAYCCIFRSALEFAYFKQLDSDETVLSWEYEPLRIEWFDGRGKRHHYKPDVLVHYEGYSKLIEVKPSLKVDDHKVAAKAAAAIAFTATLTNTTFHFITELDLPNYTETLQLLRKK